LTAAVCSNITYVGNYVASVRTGQLVFLSGHLPYDASGQLITGKVGKELTVQQGYDVAKTITLSLLSTLKSEVLPPPFCLCSVCLRIMVLRRWAISIASSASSR